VAARRERVACAVALLWALAQVPTAGRAEPPHASGPGGAPVEAASRSMNAAAFELWSACAAKLGAQALPVPRTRRFGDTPEMNDTLLGLILKGEKSITALSPWVYAGDAAATPVEGGYSIVLDGQGVPRAVLRTTSIKTVPFDQVTADDSRYEGEGVRTVEQWRKVHWAFFTRKLAPLGRQPANDMPVTLERFEVVCR
jgi:uncharacterized protein YhfF